MATGRERTITVKTTNLLWQRIIFITLILFLGFTTLLVILSHSNVTVFATSLFLTLFIGFGSYFLANYLTKSDTHLSFNDGLLTIEQTNNKLKKDTLKQFEISAIRGYEISEINELKRMLFWMVMGVILFNCISAAIIAINR